MAARFFLDEIGDLSPATQVKLLRVLQEKEFERVGSQTPIRCNVRIITATSRNLEEMIEQERFRADLYYRLNVFPIYVPPLRERKSDILLLADHFVEKFSKNSGKNVRRVSTAAIDLLASYHWPGNVRELENCIERAVLLCQDKAIEAHHLPPTLQKKDASEKKLRWHIGIRHGCARIRNDRRRTQRQRWQHGRRRAQSRPDRTPDRPAGEALRH